MLIINMMKVKTVANLEKQSFFEWKKRLEEKIKNAERQIHLRDYFMYKVIKGGQIYLKPYRLNKISPPFDFYLYCQYCPSMPSYLVKVREGEELVYFRRVFGQIQNFENKINDIVYVVGKKTAQKKYKLILYSVKTKREQNYEGDSIENAFEKFLNKGE